MNRREFSQWTTMAVGAALRAETLSAAQFATTSGVGHVGSWPGPGAWRTVPAARSVFEFHKVIARPASSPGLTNWCFLDQNPESGEVVLSYTEITDPERKHFSEPQRYDFSGLQRRQIFMISRDRGDSWQRLAEHDFVNSPDAWQLNALWEKVKFLPGGKMVAFASEHNQFGRRPMCYYSISSDMAKSWSPRRPMSNDPNRSCFAGDACRMADGRWIHFYELYDVHGPSFKCLIRRRPPVVMERSLSSRRLGCAISTDGGMTWKDRPDLDLSLETELSGAEPFEPAVTTLKNGNLLVVARVHRRASFGGEGLPWHQWVLEPAGDGFKLLRHEECRADVPLIHTGHPELITTHDGIVLGVRSDGLWASVDDAGFWEKIDNQYLGYYPQGIELDDGSVLVAGHLGGDNPWPPDTDQDVRLTRLRLTRAPVLRNLDRGVHLAWTLTDRSHRNVRVRARIGTEALAGVLARAHVKNGRLSGYVFFANGQKPAWLLGRLDDGKLVVIASGKLNQVNLASVRPRLELAAVGDVIRAFVDTYPVATGRDSTFAAGAAGLLAEGGRARIESFDVSEPADLAEIGGSTVELVRDLGAISYEQEADNWQVF